MGVLKLKYKPVVTTDKGGEKSNFNSLSLADFERFNPSILGLGDISKDGSTVNALAAIFDLEGFTSFCNQMEPHLVIPEFLSRFLDWIFGEISKHFTEGRTEELVRVWGSLPFFAKFMGDGILFLWDTDYSVGLSGISNIVAALMFVRDSYVSEFLPSIKGKFVRPPEKLRCGIARGQIISIGNGNDFIGPCINMASRLQNIGEISFAFSRRGFNPDASFGGKGSWRKHFVLKRIDIRGLGEDELIFVDRKEFENLSSESKERFKEP